MIALVGIKFTYTFLGEAPAAFYHDMHVAIDETAMLQIDDWHLRRC